VVLTRSTPAATLLSFWACKGYNTSPQHDHTRNGPVQAHSPTVAADADRRPCAARRRPRRRRRRTHINMASRNLQVVNMEGGGGRRDSRKHATNTYPLGLHRAHADRATRARNGRSHCSGCIHHRCVVLGTSTSTSLHHARWPRGGGSGRTRPSPAQIPTTPPGAPAPALPSTSTKEERRPPAIAGGRRLAEGRGSQLLFQRIKEDSVRTYYDRSVSFRA
jgi:hypothetical protein